MKTLRVALVGAEGRMGRAIAEVAAAEHAEIVARIDVNDQIVSAEAGVFVDFSAPSSSGAICAAAVRGKIPLVIGTTGHSETERKAIEDASKKIPVVLASNFSVGVNVMFALAGSAAKSLGREFVPAIVETHHIKKKDAPSGTARSLAEILRRVRPGDDEIPIQSIREGDVVGDHAVIFSGPGERLELTHRASSREIFARGALRAAHWVVGKPAGLYNMQDVLGLRS